MITFSTKGPDEEITLTFSFLGQLAIGEALSSASTTASVYAGVDASPQAIISGSADTTDDAATQLVVGGEEGVTYLVTCTAETDADQFLQESGYLTVVSP